MPARFWKRVLLRGLAARVASAVRSIRLSAARSSLVDLFRIAADIITASVIGLFGLTVLIATSLLLLANFRQPPMSSWSRPGEDRRTGFAFHVDYITRGINGNHMFLGDPDRPLPHVVFDFVEFNSQTLRLATNVSIHIPKDILEQRLVDKLGSSLVENDANQFHQVRTAAADARIEVRILESAESGQNQVVTGVVLGDALKTRVLPDPDFRETLPPIDLQPARSTPSAYPSDGYVFGVDQVFVFTHNMQYLDEQSRPSVFFSPQLVVRKGPRMEFTAIESRWEDSSYANLYLLVARDWRVIWFVYAMASVPFGFAVILFHGLFLGRQPANAMAGHPLVTAIAAVLAVLPLRTVLVPPDIQGITRVDLILGFGLAAVLFLVCLRYSVDAFRSLAAEHVDISAIHSTPSSSQRIHRGFE